MDIDLLIQNFTNSIDSNISSNETWLPEPRSGTRIILTASFGILLILGTLANAGLLLHIGWHSLYKNFISAHFIAHLTLTNMITCAYPIPIFLYSVLEGRDIFETQGALCRFHTMIVSALWTVTYMMVASIAGVHMITFARIHYDQLFGLSPSIICGLAWVVGLCIGLPCLTNSSIVEYNPNFCHCLWTPGRLFTYKFLTYLVLMGTLLPIVMTFYAYVRILAIFYHAPVVFEALGLFRSRYLIFSIMILSLAQLPFHMVYFLQAHVRNWSIYPVTMFLCYAISLISPVLYGLSLFLMKEDDIALTHRANRQNYHPAPQHPRVGARARNLNQVSENMMPLVPPATAAETSNVAAL